MKQKTKPGIYGSLLEHRSWGVTIRLKIPSNLLHMELTRTQLHKYDFSNRYG